MVIGAGTAGLAAAYTFLKEQDRLDITVLEAADKTGGRMGGDQVDGFYIDRAASLFMQSYATARSLAKEIGVLFKQSPHTKGDCLLQGGMKTDIYKLRREQLPDSVQGLFLAGDYTHLPGTNGAMRSGVDAAKDSVSFLFRRNT